MLFWSTEANAWLWSGMPWVPIRCSSLALKLEKENAELRNNNMPVVPNSTAGALSAIKNRFLTNAPSFSPLDGHIRFISTGIEKNSFRAEGFFETMGHFIALAEQEKKDNEP